MKNLIIIGAGGCGREVLQWVKDINAKQETWKIKGFLDDNAHALDCVTCDQTVLSSVDRYQIEENDEFVCCIGNSLIRKTIIEKMKRRGAKFATVVHPTACVADTAILENATIIYPFALISDNAHIGMGSIINMYSSVAHDSTLGAYCTVSAHCDVTGACVLGEGVFMGTTSNIVPGTHIGDDVYICAGSTVMASVRNGRKVLGNPAKIVKL